MAKKIIELSDPKLRSLLSNQIENALGYLGGNLSQSRRKSLEYYLGDKLGTEIDGRSQVVSTDVADTVESLLPNLLNILRTVLVFQSQICSFCSLTFQNIFVCFILLCCIKSS